MDKLQELQEHIKYEFKNLELLKTALTHSSYSSEHGMNYEHNNERMEFIGDAYLDAIIGHKLFEIMGEAHEGLLSRNRADVVCEDSLSDIARKMGLGQYLFLGKGEETSGGRDKDSILADAFEALLGAVIIDGGFAEGKRMILDLFSEKIELAVAGRLDNDFKSKLQEKLQCKYHSIKLKYNLVKADGPDHDKTFTVNVSLNDKILGEGVGKSKAKAEQAAARDAIMKGVL